MTQFIQLDRLTTKSSIDVAPIIFNRDAFIISERETILVDGIPYVTTRVTLAGYPEYTFWTLVDQDILAAALGTTDLTGGYLPSAPPCTTVGMIDVLKVDANYPMLKLLRINNNVSTNLTEYVCNPDMFLWLEEYVFQDEVTQLPTTALLITFTSAAPKRAINAIIDFGDMSALLEPIIIP
jgi:hypothetical protein